MLTGLQVWFNLLSFQIKFLGLCILVLLGLSSIHVENKWRKSLTSEPLCQTNILQLKQCFNLLIKIIKISCPTLNNVFGILGMTSAIDSHNHCVSCFIKKQTKKNNRICKGLFIKRNWTTHVGPALTYWWCLTLLCFTFISVINDYWERSHEIFLSS